MKQFDSLKNQLLFRSLLIMAVLLLLIGLFQYIFMRDVIYRNKASGIQSQIRSVPANAWFSPGAGPNNGFPRQAAFFIPGANLAYIDPAGNYTVLASASDGIEPPRLETKEYLAIMNSKPARRPDESYLVTGEGGAQQLVVFHTLSAGPGRGMGLIQVGTLTAPLKELLLGQLLTFLLLALSAMLIGLLAFRPILKRTLVPLSNMVQTAKQIDAGNLDRRFPAHQGQREIDGLAESFNGMLERLETSFAAERKTQEEMRRFIADASHELRTPLTSIRGFLDVLLRGAVIEPEQLDKALKSMHGEAERLNKLVSDLLLLARLEREPHLQITEGMLDDLFTEMEPQFAILAGSRRVILELTPNVKGRYDEDKIKQVILNLFQNAVQHTHPAQGEIRITLAYADKGIQLSFSDNGPGISPQHLPHIFERFYRSDSSRTRKYGGSGLGLAIARSLVAAHGGNISVDSKEGEGSTFKVWLPI